MHVLSNVAGPWYRSSWSRSRTNCRTTSAGIGRTGARRHRDPSASARCLKRTARLAGGIGRTGTQGAQEACGSARRRQERSSDRPEVKVKPTMPPTFVPAAEESGTVVLSAGASSSTDEMMTGSLYVVDGIDVAATLVPEEGAWQFSAAETSTTEIQLLNRDQDTIAEVDYDYPKASEEVDAHDNERKSSIQKKCEMAEPRSCASSKNSKWRSTSQRCKRRWARKSGQSGWETRKDPASPAVRSRLCATEVNTGEPRFHTFAAPLKFVRLMLNWAAGYKPKTRETGKSAQTERSNDHRGV